MTGLKVEIVPAVRPLARICDMRPALLSEAPIAQIGSGTSDRIMKRRMRTWPFLLVIAAATICGVAHAQQHPADLVVEQAWARATAPGATNGAAYLAIANHGATADRLVAVTTPAASMAELHRETHEANGVMSMASLDQGLAVPPGQTVTLAPGGTHIMLMGLTRQLKPGDTLPLTLKFAAAGTVAVDATVGSIGATRPPGP
jgi:copper(I)-binding protein